MAQTTIVTALFAGADYGIPHSQHIYDATWVDKLYNGCKRNSTIPFEMVCLVDRQYDIQAPVRQIPFQSQADKTAGWALLTEVYRPDLTDGPRLTLGLDTIICDNIDCYLQMDVPFAMVTDPFAGVVPRFKDEVCNAMTWCDSASAERVWHTWTNEQDWIREHCRLAPWNTISEMVLLRKIFNADGNVPRMDMLHPGIYSYKCHILEQPELVFVDNPKVVYFHGTPKPHELQSDVVNEAILMHWV